MPLILRFFTGFTVIWLCLLLVVPEGGLAADPELVSLGRIEGGLSNPTAIDLDADGNLWVADSREQWVRKYDRYAVLQAEFTTVPASGAGLAVEPDGSRVYVTTVNKVAVLDGRDGSLIATFDPADVSGVEEKPGELDLDAAGYLFVAATMSMQIVVYRPDGSVETHFGGIGTGPGQFRNISGLTLDRDGDRLLVADSSAQNYRVQIFDLQGGVLNSLPAGSAFGETPLLSPRGMVNDNLGHLYFLEFMRSKIHILDDTSLQHLETFSNYGFEVGQLANVNDLAFDPYTSRLFVSCGDGRIELFGVDGGENPELGNLAPPAPMATGPVAGSEVTTSPFELSWTNVDDPDGDSLTYRVEILQGGTTVWTAAAIDPQPGVTTRLAVDLALEENLSYQWRVQADDGRKLSDWSAPGGFAVNRVEEAPTTPLLDRPAEGATVDGLTAMAWQAASDADPNDLLSYRLEVAADDQFSLPLVQAGVVTTMLTLQDLDDYLQLVDGTYYWWRVTAFDQHGLCSAPSPAQSLLYDTTLLTIDANLPGTGVYVGGHHAYYGRLLGVTPLTVRDLPADDYQLFMVHAGAEPQQRSVTLAVRANQELTVSLRPALAPGSFELDPHLQTRNELIAAAPQATPVLVEVDHDGYPELLFGDADGHLELFRGLFFNQKGRLQYIERLPIPFVWTGEVAGFPVDWDNDGRLDLLIGSGDGTVHLVGSLVKLFTNELAEPTPLLAGGAPVQVTPPAAPAVIDLDGDGAKDLLVGAGDGKLWACRNLAGDAAPALAAPELLWTVGGAVRPMPVDWNADGLMDLLLAHDGRLEIIDLVAPTADAVPIELLARNHQPLAGAHSGYPLEIDGVAGKDLLLGFVDGSIQFMAGQGGDRLPSSWLAADAKLAELEELLVDAAAPVPERLVDLQVAVAARDLVACTLTSAALIDSLAPGSLACRCAEQLSEFLQ